MIRRENVPTPTLPVLEPITDNIKRPISDRDRIPFKSGIVILYDVNNKVVAVETGTMLNVLHRGLNRHPEATQFSLDQSCKDEKAIMEHADELRKKFGLPAETWRM
jgi:hypothetical protein